MFLFFFLFLDFSNLYLHFYSAVLFLSGRYVLALNMGSKNKEIREDSAKEKVELTFFPFTITLLLLNFKNYYSLLQSVCNVCSCSGPYFSITC